MMIPWLRNLENEEPSILDSFEKKIVEDVYFATEKEIQDGACLLFGNGDREEIFDNITVVKDNLKLIIDRFKLSKQAKECFMQEYPKWNEVRRSNIESLQAIGDSLHSTRKTCNISRLVGNCTSLVGGGICIASAILTPITLGLTMPLAITGGTVTFLGSATSVGSTVVEMAELKNKVQEANSILQRDKKSFEVLKEWLDHASELSKVIESMFVFDKDKKLKGILKIIREFVEMIFSSKKQADKNELVKSLVKSTIQAIPRELICSTQTANLVSLLLVIIILCNRNQKVFKEASKTLKIISNIVSLVDFSVDVFQSASIFIKSDFVITANVSKTVTKGAVALFGMTLDMASIVLTSIDVHKGSLSGQGLQIKDTADKLREESIILKKVYEELSNGTE